MEVEVLASQDSSEGAELDVNEAVAAVADDEEGNINTATTATSAVDMLQEHVYNNEDGGVDLAPELNVDENTILLPVAGENGLNADDPAIAFNASDYLQEEEEVTDPMATNLADELDEATPAKRSNRRTPDSKKTPSQVPKKRRIAVPVKYEPEDDDSPDKRSKRRGRKPGSKVVNGQVLYPSDEHEITLSKNSPKAAAKPTKAVAKPSARSTPRPVKDDSVVYENQCRVCTSGEDLVSVFKKEHIKTYAEKLVTICPTVNIQRKDFLPQFICAICVSSVNAAFALKAQCEQTDAELRSRLEKSVKKVRRPVSTTYVAPDSEPEEFHDPPQDDDFKLSDASPPSADDSDSEYGKPLAKRRTRRRTRKTTNAAAVVSPAASTSRPVKTERKLKSKSTSPKKKVIKEEPDLNTSKSSEQDAEPAAGDFSSGSEENYSPPKKRRQRKLKSDDKDGFSCRACNETLPTKEELKAHRKAMHSQHECELCGRKFRVQSSLKSHMEKHERTGDLKCDQCEKHFPNKTERRKHMSDVHKQTPAQFVCEKCKRAFTSEIRLLKHNETRCPGFDTSQTKKRVELDSLTMGKDLFKCVAPLTTTYWSDSFSD